VGSRVKAASAYQVRNCEIAVITANT